MFNSNVNLKVDLYVLTESQTRCATRLRYAPTCDGYSVNTYLFKIKESLKIGINLEQLSKL